MIPPHPLSWPQIITVGKFSSSTWEWKFILNTRQTTRVKQHGHRGLRYKFEKLQTCNWKNYRGPSYGRKTFRNIHDKTFQGRRHTLNTMSIIQSPASVQFLMLYTKSVRIIQLCSIVSVQVVDSFFFWSFRSLIWRMKTRGSFRNAWMTSFTVWSLLTTVSASSSCDQLTVTAINFPISVNINVYHLVCSQ